MCEKCKIVKICGANNKIINIGDRIGWMTKKLFQALGCFGRHAKALAPATLTVVSTHQSALGPRGGPFYG
jgi:hypothetical protein